MINPKYIILLLLGCLALLWACKPANTPDQAAAQISEALDNENVDAARSKADAFFKSDVKLDTVAVPRLCRLALTLAKLSQSGEHADDYMAQALQCYRVAIARDSVTAVGFFEAMTGDDARYYRYLRQLLSSVDVRESGVIIDESAYQYSDD